MGKLATGNREGEKQERDREWRRGFTFCYTLLHEFKMKKMPVPPHMLPLPPKNGCSILLPHGKREIKQLMLSHQHSRIQCASGHSRRKNTVLCKNTELNELQTQKYKQNQGKKNRKQKWYLNWRVISTGMNQLSLSFPPYLA